MALYEKTALKIDIGPWEVPELENMHFHFNAFSGQGISRGPKLVFKAFFLIKCYIITVIKKILERFGQFLKK